MVEKELEVLGQPINKQEITQFIGEYQILNEYTYPKRDSGYFTYHTKKGKNGKWLDDGKCEVCGKDRQYVYLMKDNPKMCRKCYQAVRAYKNLIFDPLKLKKKTNLKALECKKIVKYMNNYTKGKLIALAAVGTYLATKEK